MQPVFSAKRSLTLSLQWNLTSWAEKSSLWSMTTNAGMENVHVCGEKERPIGSVLEDFRMLVFCCQFQLLLSLHVAVPSHGAQVAAIHRQQHHGRREGSVADVGQALSRNHGGDPEREAWKVQPQKSRAWKSDNTRSMTVYIIHHKC